MSLLHTDDTLEDSRWPTTISCGGQFPGRHNPGYLSGDVLSRRKRARREEKLRAHLNPRRVGRRPRDVDVIVGLLAIVIAVCTFAALAWRAL